MSARQKLQCPNCARMIAPSHDDSYSTIVDGRLRAYFYLTKHRSALGQWCPEARVWVTTPAGRMGVSRSRERLSKRRDAAQGIYW